MHERPEAGPDAGPDSGRAPGRGSGRDPERAETTVLLSRLRDGDDRAFDLLFSRLYDELHEIAHHRLGGRGSGRTLDTTALVHEAYLRLVDQEKASWEDRTHFLAIAARAMRHIVIDFARAEMAAKRGGDRTRITIDRVQLADDDTAVHLLDLNDALDQLTEVSERLGRVVEFRFFGGLTYDEIAEVTGRSVPTVKRDWRRARTWLYRSLQPS